MSGDTLGFGVHDHANCVQAGLNVAEKRCADDGIKLTPVRRRTLEILLESHVALGAYDVLARLDAEGLGSKPPVAYRALSFLVENGFAHRIERLNAFIACAHPNAAHDPAFMICRGCGTVAEAQVTSAALGQSAAQSGFQIEQTVTCCKGSA